jgi:redox-sensitive bicupin YhaK (pirin superfamily)
MFYLEVSVKSGGSFQWDIPAEHQGFVYVLEGAATFPTDHAQAAEGQVAVLGQGGGIQVKNEGKTDLVFLIAAGEPHREAVIWNGPFVD